MVAALLLHRTSGGARIYSITPVGGPVRGDTAITVSGYELENIECIFTLPVRYAAAPPPVGTPCRYSPNSPDVGFRCMCQAPAAPRRSVLQQTVDPQTGAISMNYVPVSDYLAVPIIVTPMGTRGVDFSPFDIHFTYYDLDRVVNVTSIEPTAGHPELDTLVTVHGNGFADYGGVFCSYPGPNWDPLLAPGDAEAEGTQEVIPSVT